MSAKKEISININQNQLLAAQLLAAGKSGKAVAAEVDVAEETISRWKQDKDFQIYITELMIETHEIAKMRLQSLVEKAVNNIEETLCDPTMPPKDRFIVAIKVLELCNNYNWQLKEKINTLRNPPNDFGF
jgi:hypothetical protein